MPSTPSGGTTHSVIRQSTEIIDSLVGELILILENEINVKRAQLETYEQRLSGLLRSLESNPNLSENPALKDLKLLGKQDKKDKKKGNTDSDKDWLNYQGLMLYKGDPKLGEAQIFFDSLSMLRNKISALEEMLNGLKGLISAGLGAETRCFIVHKDGVPAKLVLFHADGSVIPKISFQGRFLVE